VAQHCSSGLADSRPHVTVEPAQLGGGHLVGSPALVADSAARVGCGGITGHATDRQAIGVTEV
jgi:hypothetical protein